MLLKETFFYSILILFCIFRTFRARKKVSSWCFLRVFSVLKQELALFKPKHIFLSSSNMPHVYPT
jgi:hypothetical protein